MEEIYLVGNPSYVGQTTVHPIGLSAVIILGLCILSVPRRWSVLPLLVMACFVSSAQRIVIAGLDFDLLRIMVLFGVIRLVVKREYVGFVWKSLDTAMVFWAVSSMFFYTFRLGTFSAFVNRLGFGFDAFGMYFLFRCLVRDWRDVDQIVLGFILISVPVAIFFLLENRTGRNVFAVFGGVPEITMVRQGRLRCQGAFSHPILAGCFWASLMPLFVAYWWKSAKDKLWGILGFLTVSIIVVCCASSTPVMAVLFGIVGGLMYHCRHHIRPIRWGILLTLAALHVVMNNPVWHLLGRVDIAGGSTGWHRFNLINQTVINFSVWWFSGCSGYTIASWGVFGGDVTNQYVLEGVRGGFLTLILFVVINLTAFVAVGRLWRSNPTSPYRLVLSWAMGVSLFVHCMNFIAVSYFGQIWILWYLLLAMIGSLSIQVGPALAPKSTYTFAAMKVRRYRNHVSCGGGNGTS